jgi:DNA polymerase III sliding clamp (beta) subunit (PCNA family)
MIINREEFLQQLESVVAGLSAREIIEQSKCFVFKDKKVMTYNDEIACVQDSCLSIEGAVEATSLISLLRKLQEKELDIQTEEEQLLIRGKRKRAGIKMETDIKLPIDMLEIPEKWKTLPTDFADAISVVQSCASSDESNFASSCIHVTPEWIEACDNYQASRYTMPLKIKHNILIRKESLKHILSLDMTQFSETKNWIHFKNPSGLTLSCRRWIEDFPNITELLNMTGSKVVLPKGLIEASEKAEIFSVENAEDNQVVVKLQPGKLKISGRGVSGFYEEIKKVKYKGKPISFAIAPSLLIYLIEHHNACMISENNLKVDSGKYQYVTVLQKEK